MPFLAIECNAQYDAQGDAPDTPPTLPPSTPPSPNMCSNMQCADVHKTHVSTALKQSVVNMTLHV